MKTEEINNQNERMENINDLCKSILCVSLAEKNEDNQEQNINNRNENIENNERPINSNMDIDDSLDYKDDAFDFDINKTYEETKDNEDYLYEYNNGQNTNIKNINVDEFCMTKNYNLLINRQNSYNFISVSS